MSTLIDRMRIEMHRLGITQKRLAELSGVSQQTIASYMYGKRDLSAQVLVALLTEYKDIDARWLLTGDEHSPIVARMEEQEKIVVTMQATIEDLIRSHKELQEQLKCIRENAVVTFSEVK